MQMESIFVLLMLLNLMCMFGCVCVPGELLNLFGYGWWGVCVSPTTFPIEKIAFLHNFPCCRQPLTVMLDGKKFTHLCDTCLQVCEKE